MSGAAERAAPEDVRLLASFASLQHLGPTSARLARRSHAPKAVWLPASWCMRHRHRWERQISIDWWKLCKKQQKKKIGTWYIVHSSTFIRAACCSSLILRQSTGIMLWRWSFRHRALVSCYQTAMWWSLVDALIAWHSAIRVFLSAPDASLSFSLSMPVPSLSAPARNASMDAIRQQGTAQQAVQGTAQRRGQGTAQPLITNSVESIMVHCSWLRKFRSWNL